MTKDIIVSRIKNRSNRFGNHYFDFFDKEGNEYILENAPSFRVGSCINLKIRPEFYLNPMPDFKENKENTAVWNAYYKAHTFYRFEFIPEKSVFTEGLEENHALVEMEYRKYQFYKQTIGFLTITDIKTFLNDYSLDYLEKKLRTNKFWFCNTKHDLQAIPNFNDINHMQVIYNFDIRLEQIECLLDYILLRRANYHGDTWMSFHQLLKEANRLLQRGGSQLMSKEFLNAFLHYKQEKYYYDINNGVERVAYHKFYKMEKAIYESISIIHNVSIYKYACNFSEILCEEQRNAVRGVLQDSNLTVLTGGPGTGKTTCIFDILRNYLSFYKNKRIALLAPTGRAAKRMQESMDMDLILEHDILVSTVHKFIGYGLFYGQKKAKQAEIETVDMIIIDESSMLELDIFLELLNQLDLAKIKLILVGDVNQLPSIHAGNILSDFIKLGVRTYYLKENHRSVKSIIGNANNLLDQIPYFVEDDAFQFLPEDSLPFVLDNIDFFSDKNILLTPFRVEYTKTGNYRSGTTTEMNRYVHQKRYGEESRYFEVGDKVIALHNNYKVGYFNGEAGKVVATSLEGISVDFGDRVTFIKEEKDLEFAYALTIHKSQGSEYENVYIYLPDTDGFGSTRINAEMLYTAITRAKKHCKIIGKKETFMAAMNYRASHRKTFLSEFPTLPQQESA